MEASLEMLSKQGGVAVWVSSGLWFWTAQGSNAPTRSLGTQRAKAWSVLRGLTRLGERSHDVVSFKGGRETAGRPSLKGDAKLEPGQPKSLGTDAFIAFSLS